MQETIDIFNHPFFLVTGGILSLIAVAGLISTIYLTIAGVVPVLYRLGMALSKRKIAIFATEKYEELKEMLVDSNIFKEKNIIKINKGEIKKAEDISLFIVHYSSFKNEIDQIISIKKDSDSMIVYAPQDAGFIEKDALNKLNSQRNTIIVNLRGRLINDILISMMTTGFKK